MKPISITSNNLHFGHFSDIPEYREVNRELVVQLLDRLPNPFVHVDVATGAGLVPQLLVEEATERNYRGTIIALDRNTEALNLARAATPGTADVHVRFVEGDAREIPCAVAGLLPNEGADSVSIHDAIHEIDGEDAQRQVFAGLAKIAKDNAFLSINSSFTSTSMAVGHSMRGHGEWKLHFVRLTGAKRNRQVETLAYRTPADYKRMISDAGFKVIHEEDRVVQLTKSALKAISRYPEFVQGMAKDLTFTRDLSLTELSDAMSSAVDHIRFEVIPRIWYSVIAQKVATELA